LPKPYHNVGNLVLRQNPDVVWNAIVDMEAMPVSGSSQHSVQLLSEEDEPPMWLIDMGSSQLTVQTIAADKPHKLVRVIADSVVPMTARFEYALTPMGTGTDLTIREEGFIDNGTWHVPIFRIMVRVMRGAGVRLYCQQLANHLGETAVPIINKIL
ncbi:MAG: hypothetical protein AAF490_32640, partial [Chloroflexota bacterium]